MAIECLQRLLEYCRQFQSLPLPKQSRNDIRELVAPVLKDVLKLLEFSMSTLEVSRVECGRSEDTPVTFARLTDLRPGDHLFVTMQILDDRRAFDIMGIYELLQNDLKENYFKAKCAKQFHGEIPSDAELSEVHQGILSYVLKTLLGSSIRASREYPERYQEFVIGFKHWFRTNVFDLLMKYRETAEEPAKKK